MKLLTECYLKAGLIIHDASKIPDELSFEQATAQKNELLNEFNKCVSSEGIGCITIGEDTVIDISQIAALKMKVIK